MQYMPHPWHTSAHPEIDDYACSAKSHEQKGNSRPLRIHSPGFCNSQLWRLYQSFEPRDVWTVVRDSSGFS